MGESKVPKKMVIREYAGEDTTDSFGNLVVPQNVVRPSTGVVLAVTSDGNYKAVVLGATTADGWNLRFYNYATTNMNSVTNTHVYYRIFYILF